MSSPSRTLAPRAPIREYPRSGYLAVERVAAKKLGVSPGTVHQWLYGETRLIHRVAVIVESFLELGQHERADRWLLPITAARMALSPDDLTHELIRDVQLADLEEDQAEAGFHATRDAQAARRWVRALEQQNATTLRLIAALKQRFEL